LGVLKLVSEEFVNAEEDDDDADVKDVVAQLLQVRRSDVNLASMSSKLSVDSAVVALESRFLLFVNAFTSVLSYFFFLLGIPVVQSS
jgi:hypothetical protein